MLKKSLLSLIFLTMGFATQMFASENLSNATRCSWGFSRTAALTKNHFRDAFSPLETSPWELCKLAFNRGIEAEGTDWVNEALDILPIPSDQVKPVEFLTKRGHCEIGSILYQKKFITVQDSSAVILTARGVCRSLPKSFQRD